ncbi:MAG: ABC transporter ATP-binding protein [Pirellulaceae bacterium]|nr:ABC transporter ATP-binding protein [Pirellulaceae bacterium]
MNRPMIELRRVHRFFGDTRAVDDVSFEIPAGEVFGYIGPNGAGKTTSMRILATLDVPTYGDAFVDGFSVVNDPDRVRRRLGFMPDYYGTYANVNCTEYLDFFARAYGLIGRERAKSLKYVMDFTGLDGLAEKPIRGLSKGMKQRLCLGRAMIHDPSVLILDEPAAGLDPRARIELRRMIRSLASDGKAILISSHILTELDEMCDRVGILEQGTLLATGSVADMQDGMRATPQVGDPSMTEIHARVLNTGASLGHWLADRDGISHVVVDGEIVRFTYAGDRQAEAALLREMVLAEFPVVEFAARTKSLEDVFLHVTQGVVQ